MFKLKKQIAVVIFVFSSLLILSGCGEAKGAIIIDGSSTVFPITEVVSEEFRHDRSDVNINIGLSGTGGGFKKFAAAEIDINNASRLIKDSEKDSAMENNIDFVEFQIAYDGIAVVVNKDNDFVDSLTVDELNNIWKAKSEVVYWSDVRPEWPEEAIVLYAPSTDSGTFDYFTEEVNGESGNVRTDFTPSGDPNVLVQGVMGNKDSLSFFGYAYYMENKDNLKVVAIDNGSGAIKPTTQTIKSGEYSPFSRPLYIYVNKKSLQKEYVSEFVNFYLSEGSSLIPKVGYIPLDKSEYEKQLEKLK